MASVELTSGCVERNELRAIVPSIAPKFSAITGGFEPVGREPRERRFSFLRPRARWIFRLKEIARLDRASLVRSLLLRNFKARARANREGVALGHAIDTVEVVPTVLAKAEREQNAASVPRHELLAAERDMPLVERIERRPDRVAASDELMKAEGERRQTRRRIEYARTELKLFRSRGTPTWLTAACGCASRMLSAARSAASRRRQPSTTVAPRAASSHAVS